VISTAARVRAKSERKSGLYARTVRYDRKAKRIMLELTSGYLLGVPVQALPHLADAHGEEFAAVHLSSGGEAIRFPSLDADYGVPGLVLAMTAREVGRRGGQVRSEAKARATKANGAKGGRPRLSRR
jgi:hypothetical protein